MSDKCLIRIKVDSYFGKVPFFNGALKKQDLS
jgi:hypothetical protein